MTRNKYMLVSIFGISHSAIWKNRKQQTSFNNQICETNQFRNGIKKYPGQKWSYQKSLCINFSSWCLPNAIQKVY